MTERTIAAVQKIDMFETGRYGNYQHIEVPLGIIIQLAVPLCEITFKLESFVSFVHYIT